MKFLKFSILAAFLLVGLAGCAGKYTGGGWLPSAGDGGKANFGFIADSCDGIGAVEGNFNYHDKNGFEPAVKMKGEVLWAQDCGLLCDLGACDYLAKVSYRSTNPKARGEGIATFCVFDGGEGAHAAAPDHIGIYVATGPFAGYYNEGQVKGNIQDHGCD
jgi:hypothetical protein